MSFHVRTIAPSRLIAITCIFAESYDVHLVLSYIRDVLFQKQAARSIGPRYAANTSKSKILYIRNLGSIALELIIAEGSTRYVYPNIARSLDHAECFPS